NQHDIASLFRQVVNLAIESLKLERRILRRSFHLGGYAERENDRDDDKKQYLPNNSHENLSLRFGLACIGYINRATCGRIGNDLSRRLNARARTIQKDARINSHEQHQQKQRQDQSDFARIQIEQLRVCFARRGSEDYAL